MMFARRNRSWKTHLFPLVICVLLITDVARGVEVDEVEEVEEIEEGGNGGEIRGGRGEEGRGRARAETKKEDGGREGEASVSGGAGGVLVVENGTSEAVVLDCPFHLDEKDLQGMHINWYHHSRDTPIYVWIPEGESEPMVFSFLQDRLDLTYEASQDAHHRHRALRIIQPTTDIAGRYECRVSSFSIELKYKQELIVYSEPRGVEVRAEGREEGQVAVICKVDEVYPQPVLYLYKKSSVRDREALSGGTPITSSSHGTYNMQMENVVQEATLDGPTEFECHVTIPNTEVRVVTSTKYQPRVSVTTGAVIGGSSNQHASAMLLTLLFLLLLSSLYV